MATEGKTPLKDASSSSSGRTQKTKDRSRVARNRGIAGVAAVVVVLVGIFLLMRGGDVIDKITHNDVPPGKVNFHIKGATFVPTHLNGDKTAQQNAANRTAEGVRDQLNALFDTAYVDPGSWGDTGEIEDLFTGGASDQLDGDVKTLTLGENAGDTYEAVDPGKSIVKVKVLTDADGNAYRASADLSFSAVATHDDGTYSSITVTGTALFVRDGDTWKIEAYNLTRSEKPAKARTPSGSASPTSEAS